MSKEELREKLRSKITQSRLKRGTMVQKQNALNKTLKEAGVNPDEFKKNLNILNKKDKLKLI